MFYNKETYDEIADLLTEKYDFQTNKNNYAITTSTFANEQKVVLTLYKNQKELAAQPGKTQSSENCVTD